ncbi:uncharacterized protein LOC117136127 [Drosophila mauritiana]|uniref:Uncharacterized protein LOC117136127 n=1 Tax=Drosophila mauritiana TaxID=7226 RepID=A0A6P8JNM0_DROMA|nr:uncharacterized protein LOC117136127 [Drosophila mauritiana]
MSSYICTYLSSEQPTASRQLTLAGQRVGGGRTTYSSSGTSYGFHFISQLAGSYQRLHRKNSGPAQRCCVYSLGRDCILSAELMRTDHAQRSH